MWQYKDRKPLYGMHSSHFIEHVVIIAQFVESLIPAGTCGCANSEQR